MYCVCGKSERMGMEGHRAHIQGFTLGRQMLFSGATLQGQQMDFKCFDKQFHTVDLLIIQGKLKLYPNY